jgi:hypothetical protein
MNFDLPLFTLVHVVISILGIVAGLVVVGGLIAGARLSGWTAFFLISTILTSVTGFGFPFTRISTPRVVGAVSLVVLAVCLVARYWKQLQGRWRATYVIAAVAALYLNVFVLVVQLFSKTPARAVGTHTAGGSVRDDAGPRVCAVRLARMGGFAGLSAGDKLVIDGRIHAINRGVDCLARQWLGANAPQPAR